MSHPIAREDAEADVAHALVELEAGASRVGRVVLKPVVHERHVRALVVVASAARLQASDFQTFNFLNPTFKP